MRSDIPEVQDTKIIKFITEERYRYLRHIVLLLCILGILSYSRDVTDYRGTFRYLKLLIIYVTVVIMCYVNMNILVSVFFFRGRYITYLVTLILLIIVLLTGMFYVLEGCFPAGDLRNKQPFDLRAERGFYEGTVILIPIILVTTMIKLFQRWMRDNQKINELNRITFNMELSELRNQINPHFLFNMLNGIKSLVRTDPEKAAIVIMKLSEFLRYQLYENNDERTSLKSEINFLTNFLDLETLRRDNFTVKIDTIAESQTINHIVLPTNLFTIFVENAVKHSVDIQGAESYVNITMEVKNKNLHFKCVNSKDPAYILSSTSKSSGLGLANIKRRLALLYGDRHILDIESTTAKYEINLTIPL